MTFRALHHLTQLYQGVCITPGGTIYTVVYEVVLQGHHSYRSTDRLHIGYKVNGAPWRCAMRQYLTALSFFISHCFTLPLLKSFLSLKLSEILLSSVNSHHFLEVFIYMNY